ncbi:hypothetical protein PCANB_001978 [Pneumocystis canis]|nr:hypothetical protein PCK1_001764 [Pneumocystis canis]KAG5439404.1 hypothetical protein PCANB_001978 [Pneumocystis canis]
MNQFIRIVPWRSRSEFNQVRDWFFGPYKDQETLIKGLSRVNAWQVRGRVPHAVESTANLICVLVQEERGTCESLGLRLSYGMALTRFVNGFLDPEQQGQYAIPMQTLARNIDLPLSFVEIRHAVTHEQLPSLLILRSMANRALEWLLDKYWIKFSENIIDLDETTKEKKIESIFKRWEILQERNLNKTSKTKDEDTKEMSLMIKESIILCSSFDGIKMMTNYLLKKITLLPKDISKDDFFNKTYAIWLPFIKKISSSMSNLVQHFVLQLISKLGSADKKSNYVIDSLPIFSISGLKELKKKETDTYLFDILLLWLQNILSQKDPYNNSMKPLFPELSIHKIIQACLKQNDCYTIKLLENIVLSNEYLSKTYGTLISLRSNSSSQLFKKRSLEQIATEVNTFRKRLQTSSALYLTMKHESDEENTDFPATLANGRWRKWSGEWKSLPIGIP